MLSPVSSLPSPEPQRVIERVFARMRATYGAHFDRQWECPAGVEPEMHAAEMKRVWIEALGPLCTNLRAIAYGLDNLPNHPPTLPEFRSICNRAPEPVLRLLPTPAVNRTRAAAVRSQIHAAMGRGSSRPPKAWALQLIERARQGEEVSVYSLRLAREALGLDTQLGAEAEPV